ncbi:MAG: FimV/HubP family polar landmark protein [Pseudomonadota bacterium]
MKDSSFNTGRFALSAVAAAALSIAAANAWALGLGRLSVQSALGETLKAEIDVTSLTPEEASTIKVRIASPDSYRSAGVDYNPVLTGTQVTLQRSPDGRQVLRLSSDRAVQEPFVDVILEVSWATGRLVREYTLLFDPPSRVVAPPAVAAAPVAPSISPAPVPAPAPAPVAQAPAPRAAAPASAVPRAPRPAPAPAPVAQAPAIKAPAAPSPAADEYKVKQGDTLYRIASKTQHPGVSLDQMLVSLYRGNPQAFIGDNMNRLKAGVVLSVPAAETAQQVSPTEARELIQAQSADFGAYRQRLASAAPVAKTEEPGRQAAGKVQAAVEDRKQAAQPSPDKLTLSQGSMKASSPEARISKEAERKEATTRVAELSRNVEELKRLSGAAGASAKPASAAVAAAPVPAPAKPATPTPAPAATVAVPAKPPMPASAPVVAASAPAPVVAQAPAASAVMPGASAPVAAASVPALASAPRAAAPRPRPAPAPMPVEEPSLFDSPFMLPAAAVLLLGLGGLGYYRWRNRARKDSGETSFLESRLQPDSFFGVSGGQRIDTRDASGVSSSMSYSLSQLDAIGDVDPVAEADVYLAYGRDLQAEEILKEAMRGNPDRLAIRTKLLEVYAKRRDTKGFEQLATQLYGLTRGEGEDWLKAQELGRSIDPENPLYQPGGAPVMAEGAELPVEPMDASTMPRSVLPSAPSAFAPAAPEEPTPSELDLDLDAPAAEPQPVTLPEATQPLAASGPDSSLDFELPEVEAPPARASAPAASAPMEFDLDSLSLDLDTQRPSKSAAAEPAPELADLELPDVDAGGGEADPLMRKLELAEEFRQIGDMEGARDLIEEVIAKANGSLKAKAQGMLETLA